jgi:predicted acetyltransferase
MAPIPTAPNRIFDSMVPERLGPNRPRVNDPFDAVPSVAHNRAMAIDLRWVGENEMDRVAQTRLRCYAPAAKELEKFKEGIRADARAQPGDFLLAEENGQAVGTTTSMSLNMWVRGGRVPIQGVAYVGTIRTARRGGGAEKKGIATQLMHATLANARQREQVASALMPFRASFYEHFGYGLAERRTDWTIPLSVIGMGPADVFEYASAADRPAIAACRQRSAERGQCDVETAAAGWANRNRQVENGFEIVLRVAGGVAGYAFLASEVRDGRTMLRVVEYAFDAPQGLMHLLHFLGAQRDQHSTASITLPSDLPLNRVLRESQLPHRPVMHAFAEARPFSRMQVRVLDHKRFLEAMKLPERWSGVADVAVLETEETISRFRVEIDRGHVAVKPSTGTPGIQCTDVMWASIVTGDLQASVAARLGLIGTSDAQAVDLFGAFADGPVPFCEEYF